MDRDAAYFSEEDRSAEAAPAAAAAAGVKAAANWKRHYAEFMQSYCREGRSYVP